MIRDHLQSHNDAKEVDPIHVGLEIEGCKFYFSRFNMRMLTIEQCLYGNGLDVILTAFAAKMQSNKNCVIEAGTVVQLYSFDRDNIVAINAEIIHPTLQVDNN